MTELRKQIITQMKVKPEIDPHDEIRRSVDFMKTYLQTYPFLNGFVLGISGGQDSTLVGKLAQMAIDELNEAARDKNDIAKYEFIAMRLPYGDQIDDDDCNDALQFISPTKVVRVDIKPAVDASVAAVSQEILEPTVDFNKGNVKARHRMEVQYHLAGIRNLAVLGTDHSAEAITGFYTKYGDGGADLMPIFRLNKRQGREILAFLNCPEHLYKKVPTADLEDDKPGLADEVAIGVTYDAIDDYLEGRAVSEADSVRIETWFKKSQHKRHLPITVFDDWWKK